uniref:Sterol carrier protein 2 n=1 Tax=Cyprinus carpio carpio TaxID=630221 RepID=A0A9J7ZJC9_CYPCA
MFIKIDFPFLSVTFCPGCGCECRCVRIERHLCVSVRVYISCWGSVSVSRVQLSCHNADLRMAAARNRVFVIGVGMTKVNKALADAGINYSAVQQACVGYVYGDSTCGQRAIYHSLGLSGIPIINVNNNCSTGSTALFMGRQLIQGGLADCVLALGFEKMERGSLSSKYMDRTNPMDKHMEVMINRYGVAAAPAAPQMFGNAGREHMEKYGTKPEHFAKIAWKNHKHSTNNPYSQFQDEYSLEQVINSRKVFEFLTLLQCCPTSDGAGAAVLASETFVRRNGLEKKAVEIIAQEMVTDLTSTFEENSCMKMVGYDMTHLAAQRCFDAAGLKPSDVDVIELHDCFSANELITYEALGLCAEGKAGELIDRGDNTYGGKWVINPSGGLISKGHPLGATGLAQCAELCWQLRGEAGPRQVPGAKVALQHNIGLGGAVVVTLYRMGFPQETRYFSSGEALWVVDVKNGKGSVTNDAGKKADCTIAMSDSDLLELMTGQLNPQTAFFQGKLKITGNMGMAMKLQNLQLTPGKAKL